jgi:LysR family pca operon transcriptional activator
MTARNQGSFAVNIDTRIKFRHLVCFLEVARRGSLARACDQLAISQPALSKTLKELETLLDATLFDRGKKGSTLTEAGMAFLRYAAPSVQSLREGISCVRAGAHAPITVQLGVLSTVESALLPDVVRRLHARHPALVVSVVTGPSAYLLSRLRLGELDLVVGRMTDNPLIQGLAFEHLYSESMTWVVRPGHPALADTSRLKHLEDYPLVLPSVGTTIRRLADSLLVQHAITVPGQRLETLSVALSRRYVQRSQAIWIAPLDAVSDDLQRGELVELDLGLREPGGSVGFCSNPALPLTQAAQWCVEALREAAQACRDSHP